MKVTKQLINDLKQAESIVIRFDGKHSSLELNFDNTRIVYSFECDTRQSGSWVIFTYPKQITHQGSIFSLLKMGDEIRFYVNKNGTEALKESGFEWLVLMLSITRHKKDGKTLSGLWDFELDQEITSSYSTRSVKVN